MDDDELEEEDSEDDEDDEEAYEWCATGESCAVCDGLDGTTFASAPTAAHPHCECEVHRVPPRQRPYEDCENSWEITSSDSEWSGGPPARHLTVHVNVHVECWNGTTVNDTIDVDFGEDPDIDVDTFVDELWDAVSDHVEELIAENCPACSPTPVG